MNDVNVNISLDEIKQIAIQFFIKGEQWGATYVKGSIPSTETMEKEALSLFSSVYRQVKDSKAQQEENDFKFLSEWKKSLREARLEKSISYLEELEKQGAIISNDNFKFTIDTQNSKYEVIDYFPKANKILIRKQNKWIQPGLAWLIKNLLKNEKSPI